MPKELEPFRLPDKWKSKDNEDQHSPRLYIKNTSGIDLPIIGGWGYSLEDCVIIDKNDPSVDQNIPFDGIDIEYRFVEKRIYAELIVFREFGEAFSGITWDRKAQYLKGIEQKMFDVLDVTVTAFKERDWEFLKTEWEENNAFSDDEEGKNNHMNKRAHHSYFYDTQFWFDITSFFGYIDPNNLK